MKVTNNGGKIVVYRLKVIDTFRFMNTSLANHTNNLSESVRLVKKETMQYRNVNILLMKITEQFTNVKSIMLNHTNQ